MHNSPKLEQGNVEDIVALTSMQETMLYKYLINPGSKLHFEQTCYILSGELVEGLLVKAWDYVLRANEMLRSVFRWKNLRTPVRIVLKNHDIPVRLYDYSGRDRAQADILAQQFKENDRNDKINLETYPLRVVFIKYSPDCYEMIVSNHHIISDGWSNGIILKEFLQAYTCLVNGSEPEVPLKTGYKDYIKWLSRQDRERQKNFWKTYLKGYVSNGIVSSGIQKRNTEVDEKYFEQPMGKELFERLLAYTRINNMTISAVLYCTWGILLNKYYGVEEVVFGTTVSVRPPEMININEIVGLFINTIPLKLSFIWHESLESLLKVCMDVLSKRKEFEYTPLSDIISYSQQGSRSALFDNVVVIQNYPMDRSLLSDGKELDIKLGSRFYKTNIDLALGIRVFDGIILDFSYNPDIFNEADINQMADSFIRIIDIIIGKTFNGTVPVVIKDIKCVEKLSHRENDILPVERYVNDFENIDFDID